MVSFFRFDRKILDTISFTNVQLDKKDQQLNTCGRAGVDVQRLVIHRFSGEFLKPASESFVVLRQLVHAEDSAGALDVIV